MNTRLRSETPPHVDLLIDELDDRPYLVVGEFTSLDQWQEEYLRDYNVISCNQGIDISGSKIFLATRLKELTCRELDDKTLIIPSEVMAYGSPADLLTLIKDDLRIKRLYEEDRLYSYDIGKKAFIGRRRRPLMAIGTCSPPCQC